MRATLHITNECNLNCRYCYVPKMKKAMDTEMAFKTVDFMVKNSIQNEDIGLAFYGGEPLIHKNLIYDTIIYTKVKYPHKRFSYNLTTNALLIDEEFCMFVREFGILVAVSIDGIKKVHDMYRVDLNDNGSHERVIERAKLLLKVRPSTPVMMTINPDTVPMYEESIRYLLSEGFRYIFCTLNYKANWTDEDLRTLKKEYIKLSDMYYDMTIKEEKFYFSPFDVKILSHISNKKIEEESCALGKKHISVSTSGNIYPCIQFVDDESYLIGHVDSGFDERKREMLYLQSLEVKEGCKECVIKHRCNHYCACLNKASTGNINVVSPLQCEHERMLIEIADSVAKKLYRKKNAMFIQKQYNEMYPIISAIEDRINDKRNTN